MAAGMVRLVTPFVAIRSAPFNLSERGRIAVKIVTATGMKITAVKILSFADTD